MTWRGTPLVDLATIVSLIGSTRTMWPLLYRAKKKLFRCVTGTGPARG
jgi:hypothetical protein